MAQQLAWILIVLTAEASASEWREYTRASDVDIHYRELVGNTIEIQAENTFYSCPAAFLHLLEDTNKIDQWVSNAQKATIIEQPHPNTHIVHTEFSALWPILSRDMVTRSVWSYDAESQVLVMEIEDASDVIPPQERTIRMTEVAATWQLQLTDNNQLLVTYRGRANPEGKIPRRLARSTALRAIHQTFLSLGTVLPDYQRPYQNVPCATTSG